MEKLWTNQEVAAYLGVDEAAIEKLIAEGRITGYRVGGKFLRFKPAEIEALKGSLVHVPESGRLGAKKGSGFFDSVADFFYFNDFTMIAAGLLAGMAAYLIIV